MISRHLRYAAFAIAALVAIAPAISFADSSSAPQGKPQTGLPVITLTIGGQSVHADIANTNATREIGLMYRQKMGKQEGMLFVFPELGYHAMWMRNTLIPLSVAYADESGVILSIHEMLPLTEVPHQSAGPARYALEMNANWFAGNKVKVGDTIKGLEKAPKPR
jgi:uncharacterized membrane protein (UPF0127 family)